jgi:hypothetical protein
MMSFLKKASLLTLCLVLASTGLMAQTQTGRIMGTTMLEDGSSVPGVLIEAVSPRLVGKATTVSDENGNYRLLNLSPGTYTLTFTLQGLQTYIQKGVNLVAEQTVSINAAMKTGEVTEQITVSAVAAQIDVKSVAKTQTLTKEQFQTLPKGRNFDSLLTTIPGVQNEPLVAGNSFDGASGLENVYYVDGVDTTSIVNGAAGQSVNFDFVEEVQVKASGYSAEFGGSLGGVINVITRSGGNEFHGEILGYYRGSPLTASRSDRLDLDHTDGTQQTARYYKYNELIGENNEHRIEGGINLGGYVIKDKLWFFGSFMPIFYSNTRSVGHFVGATNNTIDKEYKRTENYWNYNIKLTSQLAPNLRLSAGLVSNSSSDQGNLASAADNANPLVSPDEYGSTFPNYSANATLDWNVGNLQVNLRGGYFMTNETDPLVKPTEAYWTFRNEAGYASTSNAHLNIPTEWKRATGFRSASAYPYMLKKSKNEKMSVNLDLSYYMNLGGDHAWKAGVQFVRQGQDFDNTAAFPIVWLSWDRDCIVAGNNYGRGTYGYYAVRGNEDAGPFGDFYKAYANRWAIYLQDSWTIAERFTVNFGVRAESEYIPSYSALEEFSSIKAIEWGFGDKIAPRVGFVWDIKGDASTKVFGSFGIFYDVMKLSMAAGSYGGFMWSSAYYPLNTYEFTKIGTEGYDYPTPYVIQNYRIPSFDSTDPNMKAMSQRELSIGFEQRLTKDIALKARLVNKKLLWAIEDVGVQTPAGEHYYTTNPGSDFLKESWVIAKDAGVLDPRTPDIPKAKRDYWGLNLSLDKRFSNNWMGGIAYTWSRQTGNYSGLSSGDEDGRDDPNVQRMFDLWYLAYDKNLNPIDGLLNVDRTHSVKAFGSYMFPFGLTAGFTFNAMTGVPISTFWDIGAEGYMPYNRGTEGRTDLLALLDLNFSYDLKLGKNTLQLSVNVENALNTRTAMSVFQYENQGEIAVTDEQLLTGNWDITTSDPVYDPRYMKDRWFYGDGLRGTPLRVTLGLKFAF